MRKSYYILLVLGAVWVAHWMMNCLGATGRLDIWEQRTSFVKTVIWCGHDSGYLWPQPGQTIVIDYDAQMDGNGYVDFWVGRYHTFKPNYGPDMEMFSIRQPGRGRFTYRVTKSGLHSIRRSAGIYFNGHVALTWRTQ